MIHFTKMAKFVNNEIVCKCWWQKTYFEIENKFKEFSKKVNIPMDELDLLFWSKEEGTVFK